MLAGHFEWVLYFVEYPLGTLELDLSRPNICKCYTWTFMILYDKDNAFVVLCRKHIFFYIKQSLN